MDPASGLSLDSCPEIEIGKIEIANKFTLKITFGNLSLQRDRSPGLKVQSEQAEVQH